MLKIYLRLRPFLCAIISLIGVSNSFSCYAAEYLTHEAFTKELKQLARQHSKYMRMEKLIESEAGKEIWMVELGSGRDEERKERPAIMVTAGIDGHDLLGPSCVMRWMKYILENPENTASITGLLNTTTFYVVPRMNPDAVKGYFSKPQYRLSTTTRPVDDDHDGVADEDPAEDLNKDGAVTWMRVEDPEGEYILDPADSRLLVRADKLRGEKGAWKLYSEGVDNDKDEAWNEDGIGGVNYNRNFTHNFAFFASASGAFPISEPQTKALADFVIDHPNIVAAITFGDADNMSQPPRSEAGKRPAVAIQDADVGFYKEFGKIWRDTVGLKKELPNASEPGTFSDWMYYHRGRLSLALRPWTPAMQMELAKTASTNSTEKSKDSNKADKKAEESKNTAPKKTPTNDNRNEEERAFLKWADENDPGIFVEWKGYSHPDFPGKRVEIGGWMPFAKTLPAARMIDDITLKNAQFICAVAEKLPRVQVRKAQAKHLGESVYDVVIQVENTGFLPTSLEQGSVTAKVHPARIVLKIDDKFILAGNRITRLGTIEGAGGMKEARWIIQGGSVKKLEYEVVTMSNGRIAGAVSLSGN